MASGAALHSRYSDSSLFGVIKDIRLLSKCSHLVCTFSSQACSPLFPSLQVCRMGYELMQVLRGDAGENYHSLDDLYYYGGQNGLLSFVKQIVSAHEQVAVEEHVPETTEEIALQVGDVIGVAGNHWNGFSKGTNRRSGKVCAESSYHSFLSWVSTHHTKCARSGRSWTSRCSEWSAFSFSAPLVRVLLHRVSRSFPRVSTSPSLRLLPRSFRSVMEAFQLTHLCLP